MSIPVFTKVVVVSKFTNEGKDGKVYCNLKVADKETYDSQIIGVPQEIYDFVHENDEVKLSGKIGGLKEKYWYFNDLA